MSLLDDSDLSDQSLDDESNPDSVSSPAIKSGKTAVKSGPPVIQSGLHKWTITGISIVTAVLTASVTCYGTYLKLNGMHQEDLQRQGAIAQKALADQKNAMLVPVDDMKIYGAQTAHQADDEPDAQEVKKDDLRSGGSIAIHHYFKDGCVHIVRKRADGGIDSRWIFGDHVSHEALVTPSENDHGGTLNESEIPRPKKSNIALESHSPILRTISFVQAGTMSIAEAPDQKIVVSRTDSDNHIDMQQCLNPHPGTYTFQNQQVNQCIVQQVRTFYDGCVHVQLFNACNGSWDVNPDGSARVNWVRCVH